MKIIEINTTLYGSTGKIMKQIAKIAESNGEEVFLFTKKWRNSNIRMKNNFYIGNFFENLVARIFCPIFGIEGKLSYFSTKRLIKKIKKINPDIIHLHNIHGWYLNFELLFDYVKKSNCKIVWTLHDCWSFTGHCPSFETIGCDKWKTGCFACKQLKNYPTMKIDNTNKMWINKQKWFTGINNLVLVTPSIWLSKLVKESYLMDYQTKVINNGIDLNVFKTVKSAFKEKNNIIDKKILLGVAFGWGYLKGLDVMIELSKLIDNNIYQIVLVGTNDTIEKTLPNDIISIHKTNNQIELAEIYSSAYVLINPTREDNYPTVNMESIACGTPVITFNTGGRPEILTEKTGIVTKEKTAQSIFEELDNIEKINRDDCVEAAKRFDMNEKFNEYIKLYKEVMEKN